MASYYSILQYVPRVLAGERINFGVICFDDADVRVRVLSNWSRVDRFAGTDVRFLKDFASRLQDATRQVVAAPGAPLPAQWARTDIERLACAFSHSIQLTAPRASLLTPAALLDSIYADFVAEPTQRATDARGRSDAKTLLLERVRDRLAALVDIRSVRMLTKGRKSLDGKAGMHSFDQIVGNGAPIFVAHALSFEVDATAPSEDALRSLAFRIEDVRKLQRDLPFGILALAPAAGAGTARATERYDYARDVFASVETEMRSEDTFDQWLAPLAAEAAGHAGAAH